MNCHPERSLPRILRQTESKDLRFRRSRQFSKLNEHRRAMTFKIISAKDTSQDSAHLPIPPLQPSTPGPVHDTRRRGLHDLRISVTDRCNFRCTYCMPRSVFNERYHFLPHEELLTFEEIVRLAKIFRRHGVEK